MLRLRYNKIKTYQGIDEVLGFYEANQLFYKRNQLISNSPKPLGIYGHCSISSAMKEVLDSKGLNAQQSKGRWK